jgi:quercetin dioxygenase-like cupin family protein
MKIPAAGNDGNMIEEVAQFDLAAEIDLSQAKKPWPSGIHAVTLFKKLDFRIVLISMESGARMKEHHVDGTSSVQVLKGSIRYTAQGQTHELQAGSILAVAAAIKHDVEALDESIFLLTISWPNGERLAAMQHRGYGS